MRKNAEKRDRKSAYVVIQVELSVFFFEKTPDRIHNTIEKARAIKRAGLK